jgi:hypothetical protein
VALGLCVGGDVRGGALAGAVLAAVGALAALTPALRRRGVLIVGVAGLLCAGIVLGVRSTLPLKLTPLSEQVQFQRELHAKGGPPSCRAAPTPLGPGSLVTVCARDTLRSNLARGSEASPLPVVVWLGLLGLGVWSRRGVGMALALPLLGALPTALLVGFEGRYLLPLGAPLALLGGAGLAALAGRLPRGGHLGAIAVILGLAGAWQLHPGTALAHARTPGGPGSAPGAGRLLMTSPLAAVTALLADAGAQDRVIDCSRTGLQTWVYPRPVETWRPARGNRQDRRCAKVLDVKPVQPTWVLLRLRPGSSAPTAWDEVLRDPLADAGGQLVLLRQAVPR